MIITIINSHPFVRGRPINHVSYERRRDNGSFGLYRSMYMRYTLVWNWCAPLDERKTIHNAVCTFVVCK